MPTLKQLTCRVEWANCSVPFKEYGVAYGDGSVECFIPIQPASTPFSIRLTSSGYIAPGLAMFVYMDGIYQCNRNRVNLISKKKTGNGKKTARDVDFCVRQKEERLLDGTWIGRPWRFEPLQIVQLLPGMPEINKSHFDNLGEISVVVLRCESRRDQCSSEGSLSPESAMAFGPDLDDLQSISSDEYILSPSDTTKGNDTNCGIIGGLFDGADDYRHDSRDRNCCEGCARQERQERHKNHRFSGRLDNSTKRRYTDHDRPDPPCRVHWDDKPRKHEESDWEPEWDSYDDHSTASSDYIRRGYRYYRSSGATDPIPRHKVEVSDSPRCYGGHRHPKQSRSLPQRPKQEQYSEQRVRRTPERPPPPPDEQKLSGTIVREELHSGNRGCAPSIVLNVNPSQPAHTAKLETSQSCHQCTTVKCCPADDTTDDGCYVVSNNERVSRRCRHRRRSRPCCERRGSDQKPGEKSTDTSENINIDDWGKPADSQNTDDNKDDANGNSGNAEPVPGWSDPTSDQNNNTTTSEWGQDQKNQGDNNDSNDWNKNPTSETNEQKQQDNQGWDSGDCWPAKDKGSGNGDAPAAGWPPNDSINNQNTNQKGPSTSPNNGYENPRPGPSSPPRPPIFPAHDQGPIWGPPPPIQRVHTLITPFCRGQEASEPPLYTVPDQVAQERSLSHQVQVGKSSTYSHKVQVPQYLDTMEEPYAKFVFKYRVKDVIAFQIGKPIERDVEAERRLLESLPREEILNQLLHAQGLLAAQALGQPQTIPYQGQQQIPPFQPQLQKADSHNQQYASTQQQSQHRGNTNSNSSNTNQGSQPGPSNWINAPAQDELMTVPSKLTGYNNGPGNPTQGPSQDSAWAAELSSKLQDARQQSGSNDRHSNNQGNEWNGQSGQEGDDSGRW
ncbi:hypothetical protein FQN49_001126 [Arthroderma sp. PD_2]|nr:hypothetical protein FQN49_001126 [Arthroderma sp. PD_2]